MSENTKVPVAGMDTVAKAKIDALVSAYRWVCGDESIPPQLPPGGYDIDESCVKAFGERLLSLPTEITSERDVKVFIAHMVVHKRLGLAFDPMVNFADYVFPDNNISIFSQFHQEQYNCLLDCCIVYMTNKGGYPKIYEFVLQLWTEVYAPN